jgi:GAF domain/PilZ domain
MAPERRHALRQRVNTPAFASFDGVTGGMILDLSEEGLAMQAMEPLEAQTIVPLHLSLAEPAASLETTGYVAWADALGRAGVRFSELPDEARERLRQWLTENASTPSWRAPRWVVPESAFRRNGNGGNGNGTAVGVALSLETGFAYGPNTVREPALSLSKGGAAGTGVALGLETHPEVAKRRAVSTSVQYEFKSLGADLSVALNLIASRACSITRGSGAAVALVTDKGMTCRAIAGTNVPEIGTPLHASAGFSGECVKSGRPLRCDDAVIDSRADAAACRMLGIRSIAAAPIHYERDIVGLVEVFSSRPYAFDDGDLAVVERLAQTVVLTLSRAEVLQQK